MKCRGRRAGDTMSQYSDSAILIQVRRWRVELDGEEDRTGDVVSRAAAVKSDNKRWPAARPAAAPRNWRAHVANRMCQVPS